ncbi:DUF1549 and DUF1553 domain-containing protein [Blastopirellula marina]|uniref:DUF1549 and DUF1553 domain-containing protein n=1 Tax=Blastopirellula marina TaxID=124 RepID=UPI001E36F89A|nr:DUF1549 and DUF1553 domain-containing protein [Blastopirellula marina]
MSGITKRLTYFSVLLIWACVVQLNHAGAEEEHHSTYQEPPISPSERQHWAYQPLRPIAVPGRSELGWGHNEIDAFIAQRLKREGLQPQPSASRRTLIRRLSYDLTGLPPTPAEIEAFVGDSSETAYEALVERLLASPRYGERWAQHWLDLARFAETDGFEHDKLRANAWQYRDWVIQALNNDMPYDEFVRQQIAGDEIYPNQESARIATGFCTSGPDMPDINLLDERRHTVLNEMTSTIGEVFLGLQIGCAQCHDHKYDAISQADFYRLRAIFEPSLKLKKNVSLTTLEEQLPYERKSHVMIRGDFHREGPELSPGVLRVASPEDYMFQPEGTSHTAGYRTAFAAWLVSPENPLTARVIVNRVWQHHFGTGLVNSPSDFGVMGSAPTNQPLLDWLAKSLIDQGWSLKKLHRQIVLSTTYRQPSYLPTDATSPQRAAWQKAIAGDPDARLLSRFPRQRLDGEAVRDAMLLASGSLNEKRGGPGIRPPLPQELVGTLLKNQWNVTQDTTEHTRRSIYVFARRNLIFPTFAALDRPSANVSCPVRNESTTAPQSLQLLNSSFSLEMATQMADDIRSIEKEPIRQIDLAFLRTLGREPVAQERDEVHKFWQAHANDPDTADPLTHLGLALFNANEFLYID